MSRHECGLVKGERLRDGDASGVGGFEEFLFSYRPEGAANFGVLYGELHVADVPEDKLPEKSKIKTR